MLFNSKEILSIFKGFGANNISLFGDYKGSNFDETNSPRFICIV
jgi:hypothetical protein